MTRCRPTPSSTTHSARRDQGKTSTSSVSTLVVQFMPRDLARVVQHCGAEKTKLLSFSPTKAFEIIFRLPEIEPCLHRKPGREFSGIPESVQTRPAPARPVHKPSTC